MNTIEDNEPSSQLEKPKLDDWFSWVVFPTIGYCLLILWTIVGSAISIVLVAFATVRLSIALVFNPFGKWDVHRAHENLRSVVAIFPDTYLLIWKLSKTETEFLHLRIKKMQVS